MVNKKESEKKEDVPGPQAYLISLYSKVKPKLFKKEAEPILLKDISDDEIQKLIVANPQMNAATFFNLLKSKGAKVVGLQANNEADSGSVFTQVLRKQESSKDRIGNLNSLSFRFMEKVSPSVNGTDGSPQSQLIGFTKFKVVLLQEGMGNFRDAYWYSRAALESAVSVFEGAKIYADHPSAIDEQTRPERTVRDILGNFENVTIEEGDKGQALLVGEVNILADDSYRWARSLMEHAVAFSNKYPDKEFIGLSINANGDANPVSLDELIKSGVPESALPKLNQAREAGIDQLKVVLKITDCVSCDLVTEAGAGGRVLQMLENKSKKTESNDSQKERGSQMANEQKHDAVAGHDDAAQDIELIKQMIKKHGGENAEADESECGIVKEAYEACKEMGMEADEAEKAAVSHLKLAKHLSAKKEAAKPEEKPDADDEQKPPMESEADESEAFKKAKESIVKLTAENAKLKEAQNKIALEKYVDELCAKSKMKTQTTKAFREAMGTPKSKEEVDRQFKMFEAIVKAEATTTDVFTFNMEKETTTADGGKFDFSGVNNK